MRIPPPEIVASWPPPNYDNPDTRGPALLVVELITLPIALLCLALRLYVKLKIIRKSDWDDFLMVAAAVFGTAVTLCVILAFCLYGWNIHVWDLPADKVVSGRQASFAAQGLFLLATTHAKLSILVSYLRLSPANSWFRRMTYVAIGYVSLSNAAFFILLFTQCIPTSSYWNLANHEQDCIAETPGVLAHAVVTVVCDLIVWVLPLPALYRAQLPLSQRLALIVLFSFGLLVVVAACIRTYYVHFILEETYDVTWEGSKMWIWTAVEVHLGIMCGCVPWLKSLFRFWQNKRASVAPPISMVTGYQTPSDGRRTTSNGAGAIALGSVGNRSSTLSRVKYTDLESLGGSSNPETGQG